MPFGGKKRDYAQARRIHNRLASDFQNQNPKNSRGEILPQVADITSLIVNPYLKGIIMPRFAMRLSKELLEAASALIGQEMELVSDDGDAVHAYVIITPSSENPLEVNAKIVLEDEAIAEFQNDPDIELIH